MLPQDFHPVLQEWWTRRFAGLPPTPAQLEGWRGIRAGEHTLIAAPTGSGKTLAAFLTAIDQLFREGLEKGELPDEVRVVYVSPLKALSADIHKNLAEPRREIRQLAEEMGFAPVKITAAVRSGDTPQKDRAAMLKTPPHILVTTPESLYLLLTAEKSRAMLKTARVVIVDEIHAVLQARRGAHLALSLERLNHVVGHRIQRIGLSATQKPIEEVADFLVGVGSPVPGDPRSALIVNKGHARKLDLAIEVPGSPLEAVMSAEVWQETYQRLTELIAEHRTTLIFVNTRRLAERMAFNLSEKLGVEHVAAHHGSLAKEKRLAAEEKLKTGQLKVLVATASLELGIDIGHVDLVCQISSPHRIATLLQRVGRSGHTVGGLPKGRVFPLTRDDLVECAAMVRAVRDGELDRVIIPEKPLDVLAQQIVAEVAAGERHEQELFTLFQRAYPYRHLSRDEFDNTVEMLARGYTTRRGRRVALIHYDAVNKKLRGRKSSRLTALLNGGAIPEVFDYRVVLEPEGVTIGTVNEDFAVESLAGDVFQLGNASWKILQVQTGKVRVADAHGQPPSIPFWLGEAPSRSDEMSAAVSKLRAGVAPLVPGPETPREPNELDAATRWLEQNYALSLAAAQQIATYMGEGKRALGVVPTQDTLVLERFFDEAGGMQLIVHAPLGSRVNKAWGLSLRKKFCQNFNFELQAAATEEAIVLSLGPTHSFPLVDAFTYVHPNSVRETLIQAVLDSPIFESRWRWAATLSLAVPRNRGGARIPAQIQRMYAEDLLSQVFPDAAACFENIQGAREVPEHPLVDQAIRDCLEEAMDLPQLTEYLKKIHAGEITCIARDTPEPSVFCGEILNSAVYTFLDDAPIEERRTHAVQMRRSTEIRHADDLGALDPKAIDRVREEAWPVARDADELHDALMLAGFIRAEEVKDPSWFPYFEALRAENRVVREGLFLVAAERLQEFKAVAQSEDAAREIVRGRMEVLGPVTARQLADSLELSDTAVIDAALLALETEGHILRGRFTPPRHPPLDTSLEWCDRRLLARIHRYTLNRLRAEIEPVQPPDLLRFLFEWQHVAKETKVEGLEGIAAVIAQFEGYPLPASAWELDILPSRCRDYNPRDLDALCLSGRITWGRITPMNGSGSVPLRSSPIALMLRENVGFWMKDGRDGARPSKELEGHAPSWPDRDLSSDARDVLAVLQQRGASFFDELVTAAKLPLRSQTERALAELVGAGLVTADSFAGLRALLKPAKKKHLQRRRANPTYGIENAGRWSLLGRVGSPVPGDRTEFIARTLLKRYGIVFRSLLARESHLPPWRELVMVYRRLEARGEIRGGRFVSGFGGEQFALPEAVGKLRAVRKQEKSGTFISLSAADPLNLVGILTPGPRVAAVTRNRIVFRDGLPMASLEGSEIKRLAESEISDDALRNVLKRNAPQAVPRLHVRLPPVAHFTGAPSWT